MGLSFFEGVAKASSMILVSEVGDKTFFLAALMAMRHPRRYVMAGSLSALWIMTLLSASFGWAAPNLLPRKWTHVLATLLFFFFGLRTLWDGIRMGPQSGSRAVEEMREVEAQLDESEKREEEEEEREQQQQNGYSGLKEEAAGSGVEKQQGGGEKTYPSLKVNGTTPSQVRRRAVEAAPAEPPAAAVANGLGQGQSGGRERKHKGAARVPHHYHWGWLNPVLAQSFSLVFFGEWGDKSQIATIGLAAEENVWGVALGGCLGHLLCNAAAVVGGKHLAARISERTVAIFGGLLFLGFGFHSLLHGPLPHT